MKPFEINGQQFTLRPFEADLDLQWAYQTHKNSISRYIIDMTGTWPDDQRFALFSNSVCSLPTRVVVAEREAAGFFAITEEPQKITIERMYIAPQWRGSGIGRWMIGKALTKAHAARKPFVTKVLRNNIPAIEFYKYLGFNKIGSDDDEMIKQDVIRHCDPAL